MGPWTRDCLPPLSLWSDPPEDFNTDACVWYWYKDVDAIPERHWARYGAVKPEPSPTP